MYFQHSNDIWKDYPGLVPGVLLAQGITAQAFTAPRIARLQSVTKVRLATASEGELPEIQAWRRAFSSMGLKPTQYRCASEALLRRFRKEGALPQLHPLIDICNALSLAFAIPIAVFDIARISGFLEVGHAAGTETYLTFGGQTETPDVDEVIFADGVGRAHARRWTNRQSAHSAVRAETSAVLIVAEALHVSAAQDMDKLIGAIAEELRLLWSITPKTAILSRSSPRFEF
jgi:DNA/RNA-binding domain of Phe-tRNA-synthetase-like protein